MRLEGKTAVITGAASGLGRYIALRFAEEGAKVVVSDVREDPIWDRDTTAPTADLINERGGEAIHVKANVADWDEVDNLINKGVELGNGRLDILVNSAGVFNATNILDTTEEDWDSLMDVNLKGMFFCCKRGIQQMITQEQINEVRGRIINLSSQHGMIGPPDFFAYAVSKAGNAQMTRQLAVDYGPEGILVNAVAPGRILTGTHPGEADLTDPSLEYSRSRTPFHRLGRPEDIAGAALYLASDDCTYVSGHNLLVDGGWMAY